ncbi:hypothetical protein SCHPADRAFT_872492 [Schizopora paradoxa]|uniref:GRAM domain-containing protein n=1 Tax=Schizopora paradoxa TaxID=27342 RepID=A0A0H2RRE6_9AGAM|nr:hypothetical protein SCHPADRAFT_872492 [Schizopora paradoxa]
MALNWAMLAPNRTPVPLLNESTIEILPSAEVTLDIPDAPPALGTSAGGSGGSRRLKGFGQLNLTDQRLIFVASKPDEDFNSLSVLLPSILSSKFEQPFFGSNFLAIEIKPHKDGGLTTGTRGEIRLKDQGMFGFASSLEKARERAIYMKRQADSEADTLPLYEGADEPVQLEEVSVAPPGPGELPPGYDA